MFVQKFDCKVMDWSSFGYVMFTKNRGRNWEIFDPNDFLKLFLKRMDFSSYTSFYFCSDSNEILCLPLEIVFLTEDAIRLAILK